MNGLVKYAVRKRFQNYPASVWSWAGLSGEVGTVPVRVPPLGERKWKLHQLALHAVV